MQMATEDETLTNRYLPVALRVVANLVVIAIFVAIIAKTLHDLPG